MNDAPRTRPTDRSVLHDRYWTHGWAVVPSGLRVEELTQLRLEALGLASERGTDQAERHLVLASPARLDRFDPVIDLAPRFAALAEDERTINVANTVLGGPVELLKDKVILKPAGAPGYALHQDQAYLPAGIAEGDEICVIVLALADVASAAGPLEIVSGAHHELHSPPGVPVELDVDRCGGGALRPVEMSAGDLLVLHHLAPHRSAPNRSGVSRPMAFLSYTVRRDGRQRLRYYEAQRERMLR